MILSKRMARRISQSRNEKGGGYKSTEQEKIYEKLNLQERKHDWATV